ncbi:MAG: type I secretion system permease/ATPase [Hyphomicrobiaceae bacterium]|nr:MAG: type I secretion system permease/ATPase [Hyphomicrobiaceae bacterium]
MLGLKLGVLGRGKRPPATASSGEDAGKKSAPAAKPVSVSPGSELRAALASCRGAFLATAGFSLIINILMLTGAIFMLEIYDRVLPSRSIATLIGLSVIAGILFAALGLLDLIRNRLLNRAGIAIDEALSTRVFDVVVRLPVRAGNRGDGLQPLRDLDAIRSFLSSMGPTALFDLPWLPFYLLIVYAFHPVLGLTALIGAMVLTALTLLTEALSRQPTRDITTHGMNRIGLAEACRRNAEVLAGMGFASRLGDLWRSSNERALASQRRAGDIAGGLGAIARVLRMILQSAVLAVGAYLVIIQQASAGIIIAGSILAARALAPVDTAIANWRGFIAARQSWKRLGGLLAKLPRHAAPMKLPPPSTKFQVENVIVVPPGEQKVVVRDVAFALNRGQGLGIIGPSGSGKSSLARVLVGAWLPAAGRIRLDNSALDQWAPEDLGQHIGYLPQDVELFAGSILQNIARFDAQADPEAVIKAAKAADVDGLIRSLPGDKGYDTQIGEGGTTLSAGQRQRVALARALYGDPFLVVLGEPDASLDQMGEQALQQAIRGVRERGGIVIVVSHRQAVLGAVDHLLVLEQGRPVVGGPKELVQQRLAAGGVHILRSLPDPRKDKS